MQPGTLYKIIPASEFGAARVVHDTPSRFERTMGAMKGMPLGAETYTRLFIGNELWMTDAEFECQSNRRVVDWAEGDVLIAGLGIGLILLSNEHHHSSTPADASALAHEPHGWLFR